MFSMLKKWFIFLLVASAAWLPQADAMVRPLHPSGGDLAAVSSPVFPATEEETSFLVYVYDSENPYNGDFYIVQSPTGLAVDENVVADYVVKNGVPMVLLEDREWSFWSWGGANDYKVIAHRSRPAQGSELNYFAQVGGGWQTRSAGERTALGNQEAFQSLQTANSHAQMLAAGSFIAPFAAGGITVAGWSTYATVAPYVPVIGGVLAAARDRIVSAAETTANALSNLRLVDPARLGSFGGNIDVAVQRISQTKDIALGLGGPRLAEFAERVEALYYRGWDGVLANARNGNLADPAFIRQAMNNANRIHFNLEGFSRLRFAEFLKDPSKFSLGNITNWEIYQLLTNPELLRKTIFYGGTPPSL